MSASVIDEALTALAAAFTDVTPEGWATFDGQPRDPGRKSLCVGWDESGQPSVVATRDQADIRGEFTAEKLDVSNLLTVWVGNESISQARGELIAAFNAYEAALVDDPSLGDVVGGCYASALEYVAGRRTEGVLVQARFTVHIETY